MAVKELQSAIDLPDISSAVSTAFRKVVVVAGTTQGVASIYAAPDALEPVVLTDTVTAITHDDHSNRDVSIDETGTSEAQFAAAATSGATAGDLVTISNVGTIPIQASGALVATENTKLWAAPGEDLIGLYNGTDDVYYSKTLDIRKAGREPSFAVLPVCGTAAVTSIGVAAPTMLDSSVYAAVPLAATDVYTHHQRVAINSAATTANEFPGHSVPLALIVPTAAITHGWKLRCVGAIADAYSAGTFFMGVSSSSGSAGEPTTSYANAIGLAGDTTDTNLFVMHRAGTGTMTKVTLGASFPNHTNAANMYEFIVDLRADGTYRHCTWLAINRVTGAIAYGKINSNLPLVGTALNVLICRSNVAGTGSTVSVHFGGFYAGHWA
jgi:hypothetical protein